MRAFWIGLAAGVALVGLGIGIGIQIQKRDAPVETPQPQPQPLPQPVQPDAELGTVRVSGTQSSAGWIVYFHLPERARQIDYRHGGGVWLRLGANPHDVDAAGQPRSKTYLILDNLHGPTTFELRYTSDSGVQRGPFTLPFDPTAEAIRSLRSILDDLPQWVAFRRTPDSLGSDEPPSLYLYFTTLLVYKTAIAKIRYGLDRDEPNLSVRFSPSTSLGIAGDDQMYTTIPPGTREVVVEIEFRDGTKLSRTFAPD